MTFKDRDFLKLLDFTPEEIEYLIDFAASLKAKKKAGIPHKICDGKNVALIFEKTSTRTRCSFEVAARDLTIVVSGMSLVLAVNRADKLEATVYLQGKPGQTIAPPLLFTSTAPFVEDLLLGITDEDGLIGTGMKVEQSADLDHDQAMAVIAEHTKFGRGSSRIE